MCENVVFLDNILSLVIPIYTYSMVIVTYSRCMNYLNGTLSQCNGISTHSCVPSSFLAVAEVNVCRNVITITVITITYRIVTVMTNDDGNDLFCNNCNIFCWKCNFTEVGVIFRP